MYPFAGKVRECDIFKHNYFCFSQYINVCAEDIFNSFRSKKYFINYNYEEKIESIARLYSDLNALHPFREGNGRVVREFIEEVSKINGIDLDLSTANKEELITASMESFIGKYDRLLKIFNKKSYPLTKEEQIESIDSYCNNNLSNYLKNNLETNNTRSK